MATTLLLSVVLSAAYYAWFIGRAYRGLRSSASTLPSPNPERTVSILIPARNEEVSIGRCLDALIQQDYPHDRIEFIVIDDGSTDGTGAVVASYSRRDPRVRLLQLGPDDMTRPSRKRGRKPEALSKAIAASTSDIIVTTDADCVAPPTWVRSLTSYLSGDTVYVVGPVLEDQGSTLPTRIRALEVMGYNVSIAGGRIGIGQPINGHGGNTAFLRRVYDETGGFDFAAVKSDEETLLHEVVAQRVGGVGYAATPAARVRTFSPPTLQSFWNQRLRWGSTHGRFKNRVILLELSFLYFSLLFPLVNLIAGLWLPTVGTAALLAFVTKALVDFVSLRSASRIMNEQFSFSAFLVGEIFHTPFILIASAAAQLFPYQWKQRTVLAVDVTRRS